MPETILYESQEAAKQLSLPVPQGIFDTQDETALLMGSVANLAGIMVNGVRDWQFQRRGLHLDGDGVRSEYDLPADWDRFVDGTGWSVTNQWPVRTVNAQHWAAARAQITVDWHPVCRLFGGKLQFLYPPSDGESIDFEYVRKHWVIDADDTTIYKNKVTANGDQPVFDWLLMVLAIKLKWREVKGMDTAAFVADFNDRLRQVEHSDVMAPVLQLSPRMQNRDMRYLDPVYNIPSGGFGGP